MAAPRLKPDRADHAELLSQDAVRIGGLARTSPPLGALLARTAFLIVLVIVTVLALFPHLEPLRFSRRLFCLSHATIASSSVSA